MEFMQRKENITIKDIAAACAVGIGTVSRAINGKPGVKDELRRKILAYVNEVGFQSSNLAGRLNSLRKGEVVVFAASQFSIFQEGSEYTESDMFDRLLDRCRLAGYETLILSGNRTETFEQCLKLRPYAVIQLSSIERLQEMERKLCGAGIRLFTMTYQVKPTGAALHPDFSEIGVRLARVLRRAGHRKIGFLGGFGSREFLDSPADAPTNRLRMILEGVCKAHPQFDCARDTVSDNYDNPAWLGGRLAGRRHTAWICDSRRSCALFLACCYEQRLRVPDDLSLAAFAPISPDYLFPLDVTRSYVDTEAHADAVMNLLDETEFRPESRLIYPNLFHRGASVLPVAGE